MEQPTSPVSSALTPTNDVGRRPKEGSHQGSTRALHEVALRDVWMNRDHSIRSSIEHAQHGPDTADRDQQITASVTDPEPAKPAITRWERPDYSDLEVIATIPSTWDNDKMAVLVDSDEKMVGRNSGDSSPLSPYLTDPVPAYYTSHRTSAPDQGPFVGKYEYSDWDQRSRAPSEQEKAVFGIALKKKRLYVVGIGILAFILILLATVLGITLTMSIVSRQRGKGSLDSSASKPKLLLENSGLAAVNWTDSSGTDRSAVFYQDASNSVMVSLRDSVSNEWTQSNVTAAIMKNTGASRLDILSGTPLAAVTNRVQVSLYYLTTSNSVAEIWASDIVGEVWFAGALQTSLTPLAALNGSHLSAYWEICNNCSNSLYVVFQEDSGRLQMANMTNNVWSFADSSSTSSLNGTGLAILPFTDDSGAAEFGTDPGSLRMYSFDNTGLLELKEGPGTNFTWEDDTASTDFSGTVATDPSPEIAAISYGQHGLTNVLVNYLTPGGSISSYVYSGSAWTSGQPSIAGDSTNLTAIATAQNLLVYGSFNGNIYEYQVDNTNPFNWTEMSMVWAS